MNHDNSIQNLKIIKTLEEITDARTKFQLMFIIMNPLI